MARQLPALAGLGTLSHLDLKLIRADQILAGNAESCRSDLLDRARSGIAVRIRNVAGGIFAAFSRVAAPANAVHCDGERFVRFFADRAERHRACRKSLHDRLDGLHFFHRDWIFFEFEIHQPAQRAQARAG